MNELEKIYQRYSCAQNYDLTNNIQKYFKELPECFIDQSYIKNHLSIFFSKSMKIWKACPGKKYGSKGINPNVNYVLIPEDNVSEIHILLHRGTIARIKAWDLYKKEGHDEA